MKMKREYADIYLNISEFIVKYRYLFVSFIFLLQVALANYLAFIVRFDGMLSVDNFAQYFDYLPFLLFVRFVFFYREGLYKGLWRYASTSDLMKIIKSTTFGSVFFLLFVHYLIGDTGYPRSIYILDWMLTILISGGNRLLIRVFREYMFLDPSRKKILIVGAGDAAEMIVREMKYSNNNLYEPIGFVDDMQMPGLTIHGLPILGPCDMIPEIMKTHKPDEILIAVSNDMQKVI